MEAHAENTRLLDLALGADLARVLVLRELGKSCQFLEGELLELGHGGVARRRRAGSELGVWACAAQQTLPRSAARCAGDLWTPSTTDAAYSLVMSQGAPIFARAVEII